MQSIYMGRDMRQRNQASEGKQIEAIDEFSREIEIQPSCHVCRIKFIDEKALSSHNKVKHRTSKYQKCQICELET